MPIFGFVLAHNLARPGIVTSGAIHRMMMRLGFVGLLSSPLVIYLNAHAGGQPPWWPLNIFFTLGLVVALVALKDKRGMRWWIAKLVLFLVGGALVEYLWFGIAVCLTAYAYCRRPSRGRLLGWITATASLGLVNQNGWALASIPLILIAIELPLAVPRLRWAFYALYPLHLLVLAGIDWAGA
jgi:hypothetical protein